MELPTIPAPTARTEAARGLLDLSEGELVAWLAERAEKPLRAKQLRRWVVLAGAESFEEMTDLPKRLRTDLAEAFVPLGTRVVRHLEASDGTHKLLLGLRDGRLLECVLIQEENRRTACISTQVGCGMGCVFCASGLEGLERNLTTGEILEQLLRLRNLIPPTPNPSPPRGEGSKKPPSPPTPLPRSGGEGRIEGGRLSHIVVMG